MYMITWVLHPLQTTHTGFAPDKVSTSIKNTKITKQDCSTQRFKRNKLSMSSHTCKPIEEHENTTSVQVLTFIAAGYIVAPSSKQPFLNIKTPVLLIQVPGIQNVKQPQHVSAITTQTVTLICTVLLER